MLDKDVFAVLAMSGTTINGTLYVRDMFRRKIRPHIFSWFIWALIMGIGCIVQIVDHAGPGAWPLGYSALMCITVTVLSLNYGEKSITRSDWVAFIGALAAIPLWIATKNPLGAVLLVTLIDAIGFYPTFRKSWTQPRHEKMLTFFIGGCVSTFATMAIDNYTLVTVLYPASLIVTHFALAAVLVWRRRVLPVKE